MGGSGGVLPEQTTISHVTKKNLLYSNPIFITKLTWSPDKKK